LSVLKKIMKVAKRLLTMSRNIAFKKMFNTIMLALEVCGV